MKRLATILFVTLLISLLVSTVAFAEPGDPAGNCPRVFELHPFMHHEGEEHEHVHIGVAEDINGDGWICVRHLTEEVHLHVDNNLPLQ